MMMMMMTEKLHSRYYHKFHFQYQLYISLYYYTINSKHYIHYNKQSLSPLKISSTEGRQPILQFAET